MPTDTDRREVARSMRKTAKGMYDFCAHNIALEMGMDDPSDFDDCFDGEHLEAWNRLADLIDPPDGFDLDTVQRVCFECMEGCDEPEWTLYTTIYDAIARYKRGESGLTYDLCALLSLIDEMERKAQEYVKRFDENSGTASMLNGYASRIREALGVE